MLVVLRVKNPPSPWGIFFYSPLSSPVILVLTVLMYRIITVVALCLLGYRCVAQTLGGNAVFNFLKQSNTAQLSALGGLNISVTGKDVGMAFHNPALLRKELHQQVNTSFNAFVAGISNYSLTSAWHIEKANTNIGIGVNYFNYGNIDQTDASGNIAGSFRPRDYVVQVMASRSHKEKWWYGATVKFIHSGYGQYRSSGIAMDVALNYHDEEKNVQAGLVIKNMGTQLSTYDGSGRKEELPFDLQAGITKRLKNAPLQFSLSLHDLHRFNNFYNDTSFRAGEGDDDFTKKNTIQKIFNHVVIAAQFFPNEKIELTTGYNFQRRNDLNGFNISNGLNGFTLGAAVVLPKIHIRYATGFYQRQLFHQFSLSFNVKGNAL